MKSAIERLVEHFGGQPKTAEALGVSQPAVSYWLSGACKISAAKAHIAEIRSGGVVKAWELCQDIPGPNRAA